MSGKLITVDFANKKILSITEGLADPPTPEQEMKLKIFSSFISEGRTHVLVDPRRAGVQVPEHFKTHHELQIDWSLNFGLIDFEYDHMGVRGTLSFNRQPFYTVVPWEAVFSMTQGQKRQIFLDAYPRELLASHQTIGPQSLPIQEKIQAKEVKKSHEPSRKNPQRLEVGFGKRISRAFNAWAKHVLVKSLRG